MPFHKSAKKRLRQTITRTFINRSNRSETKTAIKNFRKAIDEKNTEMAQKYFELSQSLLGKLAKKGTIHKNNASRKVSRLAKALSTLTKA